MNAAEKRQRAFMRFARQHGLCSVYILRLEAGRPVKVGVARQPEARLGAYQTSHFEPVRFHEYWWLASKPLALKVEGAVHERLEEWKIRGEWFNVDADWCERVVEEEMDRLDLRGYREEAVLALMEQFGDLPADTCIWI